MTKFRETATVLSQTLMLQERKEQPVKQSNRTCFGIKFYKKNAAVPRRPKLWKSCTLLVSNLLPNFPTLFYSFASVITVSNVDII